MRVVDKFLDARDEILDSVSDMILPEDIAALSIDDRRARRREVALLIHRQYAVLPREIVELMTLLYASLSDARGRIFAFQGDGLVPVEDDRLVREFVKRTVLFDTGIEGTLLALRSESEDVRYCRAVSVHARAVMLSVGDTSVMSYLVKLPRQSRKGSLAIAYGIE
jgi:hypothetical protein